MISVKTVSIAFPDLQFTINGSNAGAEFRFDGLPVGWFPFENSFNGPNVIEVLPFESVSLL